MSIAVIGNGFWGSAITRRLREMGERVTVYADPATPGASVAAAGICKLGWYKQGTVTGMMEGVFSYEQFLHGFNWLTGVVELSAAPETFVNQPRGTTKTHLDTYLGDPLGLIVPPDISEHVSTVKEGIVRSDGGDRAFDRIVVAAGSRTDEVLDDQGYTGVKPLHGRAILFDSPEPEFSTGCLTVMTRPYTHYTFRRFRGRWRGGDTVERGKVEPRRIAEVTALAARYFPSVSGVEVIGGERPVCPQMFVRRVTPRIIAATGGHRVGYGLSGAVALRVESLL